MVTLLIILAIVCPGLGKAYDARARKENMRALRERQTEKARAMQERQTEKARAIQERQAEKIRAAAQKQAEKEYKKQIETIKAREIIEHYEPILARYERLLESTYKEKQCIQLEERIFQIENKLCKAYETIERNNPGK